jgi:hypothetical protein
MLLFGAGISSADDLEDNASLAPYDDGWQTSDNGNLGGTNFSAWTISTSGGGTATIGSASGVDIGGESFIVSRSSAYAQALAFRAFSLPTPDPISTFSFDIVSVSGDGGFVGISESGVFESTILGFGGNWAVSDGTGVTATSFPITTPVRVTYIIDSDSTYDIRIASLSTFSEFSTGSRVSVNTVNLATADLFTVSAEAGFTGSGSLAINNIRMDNSLITHRDNAAEGVYSDGWDGGSRQDTGDAGGEFPMGTWQFFFDGTTTATIASAGQSDTNGSSFVLSRSTATGGARIIRELLTDSPNPLLIYQFAADQLTGSSGVISLVDSDGPSTGVIVGSNGSNWIVTDDSGTYTSAFADTDAVLFSIATDGGTTYNLTLNNLVSSSTETSLNRAFGDAMIGDAGQELHVELTSGISSFAFNSIAIDATGAIPVPVELSDFKLE